MVHRWNSQQLMDPSCVPLDQQERLRRKAQLQHALLPYLYILTYTTAPRAIGCRLAPDVTQSFPGWNGGRRPPELLHPPFPLAMLRPPNPTRQPSKHTCEACAVLLVSIERHQAVSRLEGRQRASQTVASDIQLRQGVDQTPGQAAFNQVHGYVQHLHQACAPHTPQQAGRVEDRRGVWCWLLRREQRVAGSIQT
jgi:hypothetical protein